jgi:hypothetical protein
VVPFPAGDRFPEGVGIRLGIHPSPYTPGYPCIGSRDCAPPLPLADPPGAALGLALQREATEPAQAGLF